MIHDKISTREQEILHLIAHEYRSHEIAKELFISVNTVQTHRRNLLDKLRVKNVAGLVRRGFEIGVLNLA